MDRDLIFLLNDAGFTDYTIDSRNFVAGDITLAMTGTQEIFIGLHKPFYQMFFDIVSAPDATTSFVWEYLNGSGGETALPLSDETKSWTESGFVNWQSQREITDWTLRTVNGIEAFWVKLTDVNTWNSTIRACNMVFSNENDMIIESSEVTTKFKRATQNSLVSYIASARNEIIQRFKNSNKVIIPDGESKVQDINQWDLLRPEQLRQASNYLALAKLFFDVASEADDIYYQRYQDYAGRFGSAFDLYLLSYDIDDDGKEDEYENRNIRASELSYL